METKNALIEEIAYSASRDPLPIGRILAKQGIAKFPLDVYAKVDARGRQNVFRNEEVNLESLLLRDWKGSEGTLCADFHTRIDVHVLWCAVICQVC